jgi:hypothetical protein
LALAPVLACSIEAALQLIVGSEAGRLAVGLHSFVARVPLFQFIAHYMDLDPKQRSGNIFELLDEDKSDSEVRQALQDRAHAHKPIAVKSKGITREPEERSAVKDRMDTKFNKKQRKQQRKARLKHLY